jgi:hypothetical protein
MMKIKYVVIVLISVGVGVLIGFYVKPNPLASITISNSSNKVIQAVYIAVGMTTYVVEGIEQNKSRNVNIFVAGEAGYSLKIKFVNGDSLVTYNYVDIGNRIRETINDTGIVSSYAKR